MTARAIGVVGCALAAALGCPAPVYDADIGVEGVPTEPGALAGTFALVGQAADIADVPGLGQQTGGGMTIYLVERAWDGERYDGTVRPCRVINFDVGGMQTRVSAETTRAVPPFSFTTAIDHATGAADNATVEIWALEGLEAGEPLPEEADDPRVVDMEGDGKVGATLITAGLLEGEIYFAQRKTFGLGGVVVGPDEALGLTTHKKESVVLDATSDLLQVSTQREPHPDPKESWWHETRLADGEGCAEVEAAVDDGSLSLLRPF